MRPRSLRGHIGGLVAALAIPLIALQVWWGYRESQRVAEEADVQALAVADATALSLRQFLSLAEDILTATSGLVRATLVPGPACDGMMDRVADVLTFLSNVTAVDATGAIICSSDPIPEGATATGWSWFPVMAADRQFAVGSPVVGTITGQWILPLAAPILDADGRFEGALVGSVALNEFAQMLRGDPEAEDLLVTVSTGDGLVIARSSDAERWVGQTLPQLTGVRFSDATARANARGDDSQGVERFWGRVRVDHGWWVYAGVPAESVFGPARRAAARQISITLLIAVLGMLLAGRSYRRIGSALRELASGLKMMGQGGAVPVPEGTPTEFRAVVRQFDETLRSRDRAEEAERALRVRYQSIVDNVVFGLSVSTLSGRFVEVNPALVSMLGYPSASALIEAGPNSLYPDETTRLQLIEGFGEPRVLDSFETEWLGANGLSIPVRLNGRIVRMADGEPAFQMVVENITDEKLRENELRQTQKMEAIGRLAGGVAHDFNNLLTVIGGNTELIEDGLPEDHPLQMDVGQVKAATLRAASLTSQLLAFSRQEPRAPRPVRVNEVLVEMERMLVRLIREDMTLETRLAPDIETISIDPGELEQIIMNLVLNARDAMPEGGRILVETKPVTREIQTDTGSVPWDGVLISVRDNGHGMDTETCKRIFEPFFTTKPMGEGTGLGLSTVYGIVQRAEGHVGVESEPGRGTSVEVWFPGVDAQPEPAQPAERAARPTGGSERILVVEDEELVGAFVRRALEDAGYRVLQARDGQEALQLLEQLTSPVDLVFSDVVMPRMGGPELAERMAALWPDTPLLFMSGYIDNKAVDEQLRDHPDALLQKPFNGSELRERVRFTLDRVAAPRESV